jgi:hypothetical protein
VALRGLGLPAAEAFATPLGNVPLDLDGVATVERLPQVAVRPDAHDAEHSLEVELPFLQVVLGRDTASQIVALGGPLTTRQACGAMPINGLLAAARRRSLVPRQLDLGHSGDTSGDRSRVVGYGAWAFDERPAS